MSRRASQAVVGVGEEDGGARRAPVLADACEDSPDASRTLHTHQEVDAQLRKHASAGLICASYV